MRKLQIEDAEIMRIAIQQEIGRSEESRYDHRLHGLLLVTAGQSCCEVAELFGEDGTTVQRWVRRFEEGGLDALREGERAGRPRTLDAKQWRSLQGDLRKTPRDFGLPATLWDGPVLSEHLRRRYAVDLGVRQCQRLFRQDGVPAAQAAPSSRSIRSAESRGSKKNSIAWLGAPTSNCGVWMNVTSSNMARVAECGYRRKSRTRSCGMHRPASPWLAWVPSTCAAASSCA